ncbi:MAG: hypothetical protein ACE5FH_12980 [Candidatus Zixiibacteriota bacterium]
MADKGLVCWSCGRPTGIVGRVARSDSCDRCSADLRCCRGCRHFDPTKRFQCRETVDGPVRDKDRNNFCDYFQARQVVKGPGGIIHRGDEKEDRKKSFDDLFDD